MLIRQFIQIFRRMVVKVATPDLQEVVLVEEDITMVALAVAAVLVQAEEDLKEVHMEEW